MLLSIIIPLYNAELYIERCLSSCINQNLSPDEYEIIIINDGSTDKSLEVAKEVTRNSTNATIITQSNQGVSAARNHGLSVAKGEYIWFVDADDWIKENCIKDIYGRVKKSEVDICMISVYYVIDNKCIHKFSYSELSGIVVEGKSFIRNRKMQAPVQFSIYKHAFLTENLLQFKNGIYHEDCEFSLRSYFFAKKVTFIDEAIYFYYQNPTSITQVSNPKKSFDYIIVADSLYEFSKTYVEANDKPFFFNYISLDINTALHNLNKISDPSVKKAWENKFHEHKHLISVLLKSSRLKYRLEGILFKMSKQYIAIYKFLQLFNKRTYRQRFIA